MDLGERGIGKPGTFAMGPPHRGRIGVHRVRRQVVDVAVSAGRQHDGMRRPRLHLSGHQIAGDDSDGPVIFDHDVEHFGASVQLHVAETDLAHQCLIGTEEQLLSGLSSRIEGTRDLGAAERAVGEEAAIFTGERHALGRALVDDFDTDLRQAIDVGFAGTIVAALDGVVEEPPDRVAVVLIVLGSVDPSLGGDAVCPSRRVMEREGLHVVSQLRECGRRRSAGQSRTDDDDVVLTLVGRVDQPGREPVAIPLVLDGTFRNSGVRGRES